MKTNPKNILFNDYPSSFWAARWREATPLGNGITGASVYGSVSTETIAISRTNLWTKNTPNKIPDVSKEFYFAKEEFKKGNYDSATEITKDALLAKGFKENETFPVPLGDLNISMSVNKGFEDYQRILNLETSECSIVWLDNNEKFSRKQFVSRNLDILAVKIESTTKFNSIISLSQHLLSDSQRPFKEQNSNKGTDSLPLGFRTYTKDKLYFYELDSVNNIYAGAAFSIKSDGEIYYNDSEVSIKNSKKIEIFLKCYDNKKHNEGISNLVEFFSKTKLNYDEIFEVQKKEHYKLFNKSDANFYCSNKERLKSNEELLIQAYKGTIPNALVEKLYAFGKYLMISASSRQGKNPCSLTGLWNFEYDATWSINMANENVQAIYWFSLPANFKESMDILLSYYERGIDQMKDTAKKVFGCKGIYLPADTTPGVWNFRSTATHLLHWTAGASWISQFFFDYYEYTLDKNFLEKRAIPFMKLAFDFYEDFISYDENKQIQFIPSVSPENSPIGYNQPVRNATMDFALLKMLLTNLIKASKITKLYEDQVEKWELMLSRIPQYMVNEDNAIKEWMSEEFEDNYNHRHLSHIYPLFPGNEINSNHELFQAFKNALKLREVGISSQVSWSFVHLSAALAKIGEADKILYNMNNMAKSCVLNNLFSLTNDYREMGVSLNDFKHAPVQLDGNLGFTNIIYSMLVYSELGYVKLLPALPNKFNKGKIDNFLCKGNLKGKMKWDLKEKTLSFELNKSKNSINKIDLEIGVNFKTVESNCKFNIKNNVLENIELNKKSVFKFILE